MCIELTVWIFAGGGGGGNIGIRDKTCNNSKYILYVRELDNIYSSTKPLCNTPFNFRGIKLTPTKKWVCSEKEIADQCASQEFFRAGSLRGREGGEFNIRSFLTCTEQWAVDSIAVSIFHQITNYLFVYKGNRLD